MFWANHIIEGERYYLRRRAETAEAWNLRFVNSFLWQLKDITWIFRYMTPKRLVGY